MMNFIISLIGNYLRNKNFYIYLGFVIIIGGGFFYYDLKLKHCHNDNKELQQKIYSKNIEIENLKVFMEKLKNKNKIKNFEEKYKLYKECLKQKMDKKETKNEKNKSNIPNNPGYYTIIVH